MLTKKKTKILVSAKVSRNKAQKIIGVVDKDIIKRMKYAEIKNYDSERIEWEAGYVLEKDEILSVHLEGEFLFISDGSWMMVIEIS